MQAFLEFVVSNLVDRPDDVNIAARESNGTTVYEMRMHPDDVGKIIGRRGSTIHALRSLLQMGAAKRGVRCSLEIVEDQQQVVAET